MSSRPPTIVPRRRCSQPMSPSALSALRPPLSGVAKQLADRLGEARPLRFFFLEPLFSGASQAVRPRPTIVFGEAPGRADPAEVFHAVERGIERSLLDAQHVAGDLLDVCG